MLERSEVPDCDECKELDDLENEVLPRIRDDEEAVICDNCPWGQDIDNPLLFKLLDYLSLQDARCPLGRDELRNDEWRALAELKAVRDAVMLERSKRQADAGK